ncbi:MAG: hypothetical protein JKY66_09080 [Spongiibacteraceae bacterium]|nr:hypothetical protein [Spongiibacteraceae bacterium]
MNYCTRLYKSLTPLQFDALVQSGWREFSLESEEQKIFYPKLHCEYAQMIARLFNLAHYRAAYVVAFNVSTSFMAHYEIQTIAYDEHREYKIPVEDLPLLNSHIVGEIEVVSSYTLKDGHAGCLDDGLLGYH